MGAFDPYIRSLQIDNVGTLINFTKLMYVVRVSVRSTSVAGAVVYMQKDAIPAAAPGNGIESLVAGSVKQTTDSWSGVGLIVSSGTAEIDVAAWEV